MACIQQRRGIREKRNPPPPMWIGLYCCDMSQRSPAVFRSWGGGGGGEGTISPNKNTGREYILAPQTFSLSVVPVVHIIKHFCSDFCLLPPSPRSPLPLSGTIIGLVIGIGFSPSGCRWKWVSGSRVMGQMGHHFWMGNVGHGLLLVTH